MMSRPAAICIGDVRQDAGRTLNFLFFNRVPIILLRSGIYRNDRAWITILD